jgi:type VI protein secretion system component VasF
MQPVERAPLGGKSSAKHHLRKRQLAGAFAAKRQLHLTDMMAATATKLLPLLAMLDAVQAQANAESVFRTCRRKIQLHMAIAYAELRSERPRRQALSTPFIP